jgi:threonine/homoserine/homoserine lactone efflux protein
MTTPETTTWYQAAYVWVGAVYVAYVASLAVRARKARQRLARAAERPAR